MSIFCLRQLEDDTGQYDWGGVSFFIEMSFMHWADIQRWACKYHACLRSAWMSNNIQDIASGWKLSPWCFALNTAKTNKAKIEGGYQDKGKQHWKGNTNNTLFSVWHFVSTFYHILFNFVKTCNRRSLGRGFPSCSHDLWKLLKLWFWLWFSKVAGGFRWGKICKGVGGGGEGECY